MEAPPNTQPFLSPPPVDADPHTLHAVHRTPTTLLAWYWLFIIGGQILLPFLLATMVLSKNVRRDPTLINMIVSWMIFSVIMCILYYTRYDSGPEPPFGLCVTQASLVYGAPVMSCAAGLALVLQVLFGLRSLTSKMVLRGKITPRDEKEFEQRSRWRTRALVAFPYFLFGIFALASLTVGLRYPGAVGRERSFFFCSIESNIYVVVSFVSAILSAITVFFEGWIAWIFYHHWASLSLPQTKTAFNVRIIVRVIAFSIYSGICWLTFMISGTKLDIVPWMIAACVPLATFFIFGTQKVHDFWLSLTLCCFQSILRVWAFWIPRRPRPEMEESTTSLEEPEEKDMAIMNYSPATFTKAHLVALPPRAHISPFVIEEEITGNRDRLWLNIESGGAWCGETVHTLSPITFSTPSLLSPDSQEKDVYGWEQGAVRTGKSSKT